MMNGTQRVLPRVPESQLADHLCPRCKCPYYELVQGVRLKFDRLSPPTKSEHLYPTPGIMIRCIACRSYLDMSKGGAEVLDLSIYEDGEEWKH